MKYWPAIFVLIVLVLILTHPFHMGSRYYVHWSGSIPEQFSSNGEQIYFTGISQRGQMIEPSGGKMHMQMHGGGCVACHGADREGGRMLPRFWVDVPPLTAVSLFGDGDDHGHDDHIPYTDESLKNAIRHGISESGRELEREMPRWTISDDDLADLIAYLRQ